MNVVFSFLLLTSREVYLASVVQKSVNTPMTPPPTHSPSAWRFRFRFQGWLLCCDVTVVTGSAWIWEWKIVSLDTLSPRGVFSSDILLFVFVTNFKLLNRYFRTLINPSIYSHTHTDRRIHSNVYPSPLNTSVSVSLAVGLSVCLLAPCLCHACCPLLTSLMITWKSNDTQAFPSSSSMSLRTNGSWRIHLDAHTVTTCSFIFKARSLYMR